MAADAPVAASSSVAQIMQIADGLRQSLAASIVQSRPALGDEIPILCLGPFRATTRGLEVIGEATRDEVAAYAAGMQTLHRSIHWIIGDLLNYAEGRYGESYAQMVDAFPYDEGTLRNDKWVAARIPIAERLDPAVIPHSFHADVAALPRPERQRLLHEAQQNGFTRGEFRERVRAARAIDAGPVIPGLAQLEGIRALCDEALEVMDDEVALGHVREIMRHTQIASERMRGIAHGANDAVR